MGERAEGKCRTSSPERKPGQGACVPERTALFHEAAGNLNLSCCEAQKFCFIDFVSRVQPEGSPSQNSAPKIFVDIKKNTQKAHHI